MLGSSRPTRSQRLRAFICHAARFGDRWRRVAGGLSLPSSESFDERVQEHLAALATHPMTRQLFQEFHLRMRELDDLHLRGDGQRVELGSGVYPVKRTFSDVLATDVVSAPGIDVVLDAEAMDLPDLSVRCFYAQFVFHHLGQPSVFFRELERVCVPGGGAVLIEPAAGPFAGLLFRRLFSTETFDRAMPGWEAPVEDPMTGANQALSWVVFERDRARFEREHPRLRIVAHELSPSYLRYIASGGLNFPQLVPTRFGPALETLERLLPRLRPLLAVHQYYVIRKT